MATETAPRCGHCLDPIRGDEGIEVAGSLVCPTCARLAAPAGRPRPPRPADSVAAALASNPDGNPDSAPARDAAATSPTGNWVARRLDDIDDWCQGKWWAARIPFLLLSLWVWVRHASDPLYRSLFGGLNLGIHELGHFVFAPFGDLPGVFGGSLLQCLAPVVAMILFVRQRDYFAVAFAWVWLGTNGFEVATYAGDAVRMELPLVTPGGGHPIHDWNYLLGDLGWLRHTETIAGLYRGLGHTAMLAGVAGMLWILSKMVASAARLRRT